MVTATGGGEWEDRGAYMATVRETNLGVLPADNSAPEPSEVEAGIKLGLVGPGRGHTANVDDWGFWLVKAKDSGDIFACSDGEGEAYERDWGPS